MVALGLVLLAAPDAVEGPVLLPISPGHALSRLDAIALVPLVAGSFSLYYGLWRHRGRLRVAAALVFVGGFGLGLLIASAFSAFFWWWAIGAVLFGSALLTAVLVAADSFGEREGAP